MFTGIVEDLGEIEAIEHEGDSARIYIRSARVTEDARIGLPPDLRKYVAQKGSVTVDGISLTVSAIGGEWFEVSLIPETLKRTTLGAKRPGEPVNLEVDVIAKYVETLLGGAQ